MPYFNIVDHTGRRIRQVLVTGPGELTSHACEFCGVACDVVRSHPGIKTGPVHAPVLTKPHDRWTCPRDHEPWHGRMTRLELEKNQLESPILRGFVQRDIDNLRRQHTR